jgi:hypothetical protein
MTQLADFFGLLSNSSAGITQQVTKKSPAE